MARDHGAADWNQRGSDPSDLDLDALGPLARPGIIDRDLVKQLIDFASPG